MQNSGRLSYALHKTEVTSSVTSWKTSRHTCTSTNFDNFGRDVADRAWNQTVVHFLTSPN